MPPSSPPSEHDVSTDGEEPFLTNQDVEILHLIVSHAQNLVDANSEQHPNAESLPTFKALFAAYDTILEENGIDPWHDQTYFRFLLRMGGWVGTTLFEKFEALLEEMGIRLEFDDERQEPQDVPRDRRDSDLHVASSRAEFLSCPTSPRGRPRRASFDTVYDAGDESTHRSTRRATSESSRLRHYSEINSDFKRRHVPRAAYRVKGRTQSHVRSSLSPSSSNGRGRLTARDFPRASEDHNIRDASASSYGGIQVWRRERSRDVDAHAKGRIPSAQPDEPAVSAGDRTVRSLHYRDLAMAHQLPETHYYHPPQSQMSLHAEEFSQHHAANVARRLLQQWRACATQSLSDHRRMERMAHARDTGTLLRQAFEQWRVVAHAKRQSAETERFFSHLGRRADKARDLYLLTKAFTHWAQSTLDELQRTSVARRHILRSKYFNAWRDITAVNDLKVRRQILKKFLGIWKSRSIRVLGDNINALSVYHVNIIRRVYWRWFWAFCETRAPQWWAEKIKKTCIQQWIISAKEKRDREQLARGIYNQRVLKRFLAIWTQRTRRVQAHAPQAVQFGQERIARNALIVWRISTRLSPRVVEVSNRKDWKLARSAFTTWVGHMRIEKQAGSVDRLRILRNAWTGWNDLLRKRTLGFRIDDRIVLQALYRWVLAERSILLQRLIDRRLKQTTLIRLARTWKDMRGRLVNTERVVQGNRDWSILKKMLALWKLQMQSRKERERLALGKYGPKIIHGALRPWINRLEHVQQLQQWSKDAEHYFLMSRSLKKLQAAVIMSRRQKRRNAYGRIRRLLKTHMAAKALNIWRQRTLQISNMREQAESAEQHHIMVFAIAQFDAWRTHSLNIAAFQEQADAIQNRRLAVKQLSAWQTLLQRRKSLEEQAEAFAQARISAMAAVYLNKISLQVFEIRAQQEKAEAWKDRKEKKRFRSILRHWIERADQRQGSRHLKPFLSMMTPHRDRNDDDNDDEAVDLTRRAEDWTAFEEGLDLGSWKPGVEAQSSLTPLPGYMRTPSKAARAKALIKGSTTPATPHGTPFERRLRSQVSMSRSSALRTGFGNSIVGSKKAVTEDIPETSLHLVNGDS